MVSYILKTDTPLWESYKETVSQTQTLDEPLVRYIVERVIDRHGRGEVPDAYLEWYDGEREEMPRPQSAD